MENHSLPFYQKFSFNLISLTILCALLYFGKAIILPVLFSILLATMILPLTNFLVRRRVNRIVAISLPLFFTMVAGFGIIYFLSTQIVNFLDDVPALKERFNSVSHSFQLWIKQNTSITIWKQNEYIKDTVKDLKDDAPSYLGSTLSSLTEIITYTTLIPIYTFLILYYRSNIKAFLFSIFQKGDNTDVAEILTQSATISQHYLTGLLIETTIVFALNSIGFLILGIKYVFFLALLAALLNIIPYVGILVANVLCMTITLVSSDKLSDVLWVGIILAIVQFWDNNFGMTFIVGNRVRINGLVTIIGVLVGAALCGIPGMFLAIPGLAVLKVVFDRVPEFHPWGMLLGDTMVGDKKDQSKAVLEKQV
jgi:predicted PurR-regulated permease PerM